MSYDVAIDIGTSYTAAAVNRNGRSEIVTLGNRTAVMPSVIYLGADESILVGNAASRRALTDPGRVVREFKRRFGDPTPFILGGSPYSAEALTARLMTWVVGAVSELEGGPPAGAVFTHPANWGEYKKDLLRQAVRLSGLPGAQYISEPEAAAIYYSSLERVELGMIVAVYDLGGGTFDAVLLQKTGDVRFEILGQPEGIERLGGIDFDEAVFQHVAVNLGGAIGELDSEDPVSLSAVGRLREECVAAKEALSTDTDASIPVLLPNINTEVRITRSEFEAMIRPTLADTLSAMGRAVISADMQVDGIDRILLVGGSSRIPLVGQLVAAEFDRPIAVDAQPKHAVALGAAAMAGLTTDEDSQPSTQVDAGSPSSLAPTAASVETSNDVEIIDDKNAVAATVVEEVSAKAKLLRVSDRQGEAGWRRLSPQLARGAAAVIVLVLIVGAVIVFSGDDADDQGRPGTGVATPITTTGSPGTEGSATASSVTATSAAVTSVTTTAAAQIHTEPFEVWVLTTVDGDGGTGVRPSLAAAADGSHLIVYWNPTADDLRFGRCRDPECRSVAMSIIDQPNVGEWPAIAVGTDGLPVVAYYDQGVGQLKVAHCQDGDCAAATISVVDASGSVGSFNSVVIGNDGLPIISYYDEGNADLKVAHCDVFDCTSVTVSTVDSSGNVGAETSITIGSDGLPVISYSDKETSQLKVAHCEATDCSAATIVTVDVGGIGTSIAVGAEGFPIISYGVLSPNQVRLAQCLDMTCATTNIFIIDESTLDITCEIPRCMGGSETSLTVDASGLPHVSYHHDAEGLRMARCEVATCDAVTAYSVDTHREAGIYSSINVDPSGATSIAYFSGEGIDLRIATTGP